ncbi:MAG: methionine--tRNA ligase [Candidatus Micrarchaeota archaeon]|nr:methionine--tRNA ligase [Candidatus Micrarchaeota archaeon]
MVSLAKFYLTTAIPYVNAAPHLGHVLEFLQADAIARYRRLLGEDVALVTGADENSLKNVQAAEKQGISAMELCDRNSEIFRKMADRVGLSYTSFQRTSDRGRHWPGAQRLWELCFKKGDIYKRKYVGLYCVGCEAFYEPEELSEGLCPEHRTAPERIEEENYFFRLSRYQSELERLIQSDELRIVPQARKNEVLSFIKGGLRDFSVSRSVERARGWGVPVPGDASQMEYVWFDALATYMTGVGFGTDEKLFEKYWPADVHVIGKGILRFHAVYWPAMLLSAGLPLPRAVLVHGYITIEGQKMSKSLGNIIDPQRLIDEYGVEPLRYCLLSEPTFEDGDFSEKVLVEKNNNELLANIGNLVNRVLVFAHREFGGMVPEGKPDAEDEKFVQSQSKRLAAVGRLLEELQLKEALATAMEAGKEANAYFQKNEPWKKAKTDRERCRAVIYVLLHQVKDLAIALEPFLPFTSREIFKQLNAPLERWSGIGKFTLKAGHSLGAPSILFRKIEKKTQGLKEGQQETGKAEGGGKVKAEFFGFGLASLDLEVGKIISVEKHPHADKLYIEKVQMGGGEIRQLVSGLAPYCKPDELIGKNVIVVKNLKAAMLRFRESKGMLLACEKDGKLEVLSVPWAKPGDKVEIEGVESKPLPQITIEQFFSVRMEVRGGTAYADGKRLAVCGRPVKTEKLLEGRIS